MAELRTAAVLERPIKDLGRHKQARPTPVQKAWLRRGIEQPGGKLPLFDEEGQRYNPRTIQSCLEHGWAAPWMGNPTKPDWLVCKLTEAGRDALANGR